MSQLACNVTVNHLQTDCPRSSPQKPARMWPTHFLHSSHEQTLFWCQKNDLFAWIFFPAPVSMTLELARAFLHDTTRTINSDTKLTTAKRLSMESPPHTCTCSDFMIINVMQCRFVKVNKVLHPCCRSHLQYITLISKCPFHHQSFKAIWISFMPNN